MADWSLPVTTTLYTGVLSDLDDRLDELAKMFNGASPTNLPIGSFRIDGTSNNELQTWDGGQWDTEALAVQTLRIGQDGGNLEASATDLAFFTDANISSEGNLNFYVDSNNDQTDRLFRWYNNAAATSGANLLMSLSEAGVLALTGQMSINSGGSVNNFSLNANTGFDSRVEFRENNVIRALEIYDESDDSYRLQKIAVNGTTIQAELRLRNSGTIDAVTGTLRQGTNAVLHAGGGQTIAANFAENAIGFRIQDTGTNAELEFYPDLGAAFLNPKSQVDDFGIFFSDSAIDLAKGIIGVWGGAGAPAIRFDAVAKTLAFEASGGYLFESNIGIEIDISTVLHPNWIRAEPLGSDLNIATSGAGAAAALNSTDIAFIDSSNKDLRVYRFNGSTWSEIGTELTITGVGVVSLAAMNGTDVAFIDSLNDDLRLYRWSGSSWSLIGSELNISGVGGAKSTALNSTDIAFIDSLNEDLRVYRFNGSTWSEIGTELNITGAVNADLAALNGTDVAYIDSINEDLRLYRWSGSSWSLIGSELNIPGIGSVGLTALNGTDVAFYDITLELLRVYRFDGSDWSSVSDDLSIPSVSTHTMTSLNGTDIAFFDSQTTDLRAYRFSFSRGEGPYGLTL